MVADISVPETWQGKGFFQALIAALYSPQQGIDLIELENVINQRLARHLERYGWISRNGMAIWGCWVTTTAGVASASSAC